MTIEKFIATGAHYGYIYNMKKEMMIEKYAMEELKLSKKAAQEVVAYEAQEDTEFDYDRFYTWYVLNVMAHAIAMTVTTKNHHALKNFSAALSFVFKES